MSWSLCFDSSFKILQGNDFFLATFNPKNATNKPTNPIT